MEWNKINKSLISNSKGEEFAVGLQWKPHFTESSKLRRKLAFSRMISKEELKHGARLEVDQNGTSQLAVADASLDKKPSLAAILGHHNLANATIFMRVTQEDYWVLSLTESNAIELSSDKLFNFFGVRDYIEERIALQGEESVRIINIGEPVSFDAATFEHKIEEIPFEKIVSGKVKENCVIAEISSSLASRLMIGVYGSAALLLGAGYMYATHESEKYLSLKNGEHSQMFNSQVASLNQSYKKVLSGSKNKRMDTEAFITEARGQYNNAVLTRKFSNHEVINHIRAINDMLPRNLGGWKVTEITYNRQTFEVKYERVYGAKQSLNYKLFSDKLTKLLSGEEGYSASLSRIENQAGTAIIEISPVTNENLALIDFLDQKRGIDEKRSSVAREISSELKKLGFSSQEISEIEGSISMLGMLEKKDDDLLDKIAERIDSVAMKEQPRIKNIKKLLKTYSSIKDIDIPKHEHTILPEGGTEDHIYPILQDTIGIEWAPPQEAEGFPVGVEDQVFKGSKVLKERVIDVKLIRPLWHSSLLNDLLDRETVNIRSLIYNTQARPAPLMMKISTIEANQAFIKLEKNLN